MDKSLTDLPDSIHKLALYNCAFIIAKGYVSSTKAKKKESEVYSMIVPAKKLMVDKKIGPGLCAAVVGKALTTWYTDLLSVFA